MTTQTGVLLINLGTPKAPTTRAVRQFLKEFLSDPLVIDLPTPVRWLLLQTVILPFRSPRSAHAYQKIWTDQGSPLLYLSERLVQSVQQQLGSEYCVTLGMRYGTPSIKDGISLLLKKQVRKIIFLPLFPHDSKASLGTAIKKVLSELLIQQNIPEIEIKTEFFNHPLFIQSYAKIIQNTLSNHPTDLLLFSYHGLPERFLDQKNCQAANCNRSEPCSDINKSSWNCYRAQCFETSRLIAKNLALKPDQYSTSFQSRLGNLPWIQPYTTPSLEKFAQQGIKNLAVVCPSFVTDCLETLEEIGIRAKEQWQQLGGKNFTLIPCLNHDEHWINALSTMIKNEL